MLISVENDIFSIDNFSKNSSNFIRIFNSDFGLGFFSIRPKKTSNFLFELINK